MSNGTEGSCYLTVGLPYASESWVRTTSDKCLELRGQWRGDQAPPITCLFGHLFAGHPESALWHARDIETSSREFRDRVLSTSSAGARVTAYHDQFADEIARIVQADSELTATVIESLVLGYRFVLALLNVDEQRGRSTIRISLALFESASEIFERIRAQSGNDDLIAALNHVQSQLGRLIRDAWT